MRARRVHFPVASPPDYRKRGCRALTLVELMIGLSVTAVTAAILAVLINATAAGTNANQDGRRLLVRMEALKSSIADELTNARCILAAGSNYIVYWTGDASTGPVLPNNAVNLYEMRLLEVDSSGNLKLYTTNWPANFSDVSKISANTTYAATSNWYSACTTAKSGGYFTPAVLETNVTSMSTTLDASPATKAELATITITLNDNGSPRNVLIGVSLTNSSAPW